MAKENKHDNAFCPLGGNALVLLGEVADTWSLGSLVNDIFDMDENINGIKKECRIGRSFQKVWVNCNEHGKVTRSNGDVCI
jgi:hypothetical protein